MWKIEQKEITSCMIRDGFPHIEPEKRSGPLLGPANSPLVGTGLTRSAIDRLNGTIAKRIEQDRRIANPNQAFRDTLSGVELGNYEKSLFDCEAAAGMKTQEVRVRWKELGEAYNTRKNDRSQKVEEEEVDRERVTNACIQRSGLEAETALEALDLITYKIEAANGDIEILEREVLPFDREVAKILRDCSPAARGENVELTAVKVFSKTEQEQVKVLFEDLDELKSTG